ncbi:MAG: DUF1127 domain-containing protein [Pseudomonadota bacterium]
MIASDLRSRAPSFFRFPRPEPGIWGKWLRRRAMKRLLDLDDHMLDDIGVTREEVETAAAMPLSVNAAVELHRTALERRRAGR